MAPSGENASLGWLRMALRFAGTEAPPTSTVPRKMCEFVVAPAVITLGASPGELIELKFG